MRAVLAFLLIVLLAIPLTLAALSLLSISSWALDPVFYSRVQAEKNAACTQYRNHTR